MSNLTHRISVNVTEAERDMIKRAAKKDDRNMSDFARQTLLRVARTKMRRRQ